MNLSENEDYLKLLYIAEPGHGKTTAMATLANRGKLLYIDYESGLRQRPLRNLGIKVDNIQVEKPANYDELLELHADIAAELVRDPSAYAGVAFDSFTEFQAKTLEEAGVARIEMAKAKGKTGTAIDPSFTDVADYGVWTTLARRAIRRFRDLPCHVAFSVLPVRDVTDEGVIYRPLLSPKVATELMGHVDVIVHMLNEAGGDAPDGVDRFGITRAVKFYMGKDRLGITPTVLANPSFERLVGLLADELDIATDVVQREFIARQKARQAE